MTLCGKLWADMTVGWNPPLSNRSSDLIPHTPPLLPLSGVGGGMDCCLTLLST